MKKLSVKKRVLLLLCVLLSLASIACFVSIGVLVNLLPSQREAERWQGEGETSFGQVTCFLPVDSKIDLNQIYQFRYAVLDKLHEAGFEADTDTLLFRDAWSTTDKVAVSSALGKGQASAIAVGGHFFDFHPLRLLSGSYISEDDLMQDRVLLDEELAWMLFGGTDLQGMEMRIEGVPFVIAGVIEREQDFATMKAYTSGMGLFMSYDAYTQLKENAGASCYELCMAEPVKDYVAPFVKEKFPIGQGEIVDNSRRFSVLRLLGLLGSYGNRSMQTNGVLYPYWENAARCVEDWSAMLLFLGLLCAAFPAVYGIVTLIRWLKRGKEKLSEEVLPAFRNKVEDTVEKQKRKRWEKQQEKH